ncbi:hypothetical protein Tco_0338094, partial [Tanacetum coccineum]
KRIKATTKVSKSGKNKLPAQGLETLSEIASSEAEQIKITSKRSRTHFHSSHASGSDDQISWKSSDEDDDDEVSLSKDDDDNSDDEDDVDQVSERIDSDNDGDDLRIRTPSHYESTDDEAYDEVAQGKNVEEEKLE